MEARRDLEEAMRVAKRSEMRLFQCDAHLGFARLAVVESNQATARQYVAEARWIAEATGYRRRRAEIKELELLLDSGLT